MQERYTCRMFAINRRKTPGREAVVIRMISNAPLDDLTTRSNLNYLREESLVTIGVLAGVAGYIWLWFDIWPVTGSSLPLSAWIGGSALALGSILGYGLRQKNLHLAIHVLAWNLLLAAI